MKFELALRPVGSGLEQGAELVGGAHFGAPRMFGGEVGLQSKYMDAGHVPGGHCVPHDAGFALRSILNRLQLGGWITHLRSFICCGP